MNSSSGRSTREGREGTSSGTILFMVLGQEAQLSVGGVLGQEAQLSVGDGVNLLVQIQKLVEIFVGGRDVGPFGWLLHDPGLPFIAPVPLSTIAPRPHRTQSSPRPLQTFTKKICDFQRLPKISVPSPDSILPDPLYLVLISPFATTTNLRTTPYPNRMPPTSCSSPCTPCCSRFVPFPKAFPAPPPPPRPGLEKSGPGDTASGTFSFRPPAPRPSCQLRYRSAATEASPARTSRATTPDGWATYGSSRAPMMRECSPCTP